MSMWKAALLGALIPATFGLPASAQEGPGDGPRMMFEALDLNADGVVTLEELQAAGPARFAAADADGNGVLDRAELLARAAARAERGVDRILERADTDGDGALSAEEMADAREGRRGADPERMFRRLDADGDGAVSAAEFEDGAARFRERHGERHGGPRWGQDRG